MSLVTTSFQGRCYDALVQLYREGRQPRWVFASTVARRVSSSPSAAGRALTALAFRHGPRGPVTSSYLPEVDRVGYAPRELGFCSKAAMAWIKGRP